MKMVIYLLMAKKKKSILEMTPEEKMLPSNKKKKKKEEESKSLEEVAQEVAQQKIEDHQEFLEILNEVEEAHKDKWDIPLTEPVLFFDSALSYELSGYRPINEKKGLDFDPKWFTEARETFLRTGHYCQYPRKTKAYADFWDEEYRRCRKGMTVNGYTITGDHYFFLNYYQLMDLDSAEEAGGGRVYAFPTFYVGQYEWFHYISLCRKLRLNACLMKSREVKSCLAIQ